MYVFKTSVSSKEGIQHLTSGLNQLLKGSEWNFDLEDCDNILRIDSRADIAETVIHLLQDQGFDCKELPD